MDGRTAAAVTQIVRDAIDSWRVQNDPADYDGSGLPEWIMGTFDGLGLVVCADGEANLGGRAVAGQWIAPTTVHIGRRCDRFTVTCDPGSNVVLAFPTRLVPLDEGTDR